MIHNRIEIWRLLALCLLLTACSQTNKRRVDLISENPTHTPAPTVTQTAVSPTPVISSFG